MAYAHCIDGRRKIKLKQFDPDDDGGLKREAAEKKTAKLGEELTEIQELLSAAGQTAVLVVLQGMDTSGKDGAIRRVMDPVNPQGCEVASFKVPTSLELSHDFLWRVHARTPARGQITIFNRSHYEDVLIVRVHELAPEDVWRRRYQHINDFERLLVDSRTVVLKFYLHISHAEQQKRLLERQQDKTKFWKLSVGDWKERQYWDAYIGAYEDAINRCSTRECPWYIIPANRKWFRNLAITEAIVDTLKPLKKGWLKHLEEIGRTEIERIKEFQNNPAVGAKARP